MSHGEVVRRNMPFEDPVTLHERVKKDGKIKSKLMLLHNTMVYHTQRFSDFYFKRPTALQNSAFQLINSSRCHVGFIFPELDILKEIYFPPMSSHYQIPDSGALLRNRLL